jgi:hypothetical protein
MLYTEYKYDPEWVAADLATKQANIKANLGDGVNLLKNGLKVIAGRLDKDPMRYRDYGPYWWAIKSLLKMNGVKLETLIMAEAFRDDYLKTYLRYSNQFVLDGESGDLIEIVDGDMEGL